MKVKFYRWYNSLLASLLTFLGYGCTMNEPIDMYGTPILMYGTPTVTYNIKGTVTDEDGKAINGIKVKATINTSDEANTEHILDAKITDAEGKYIMKIYDYIPVNDSNHKLIIEDIDGAENGGEFQSDTIKVTDLEIKKISGPDGEWNLGVFEINADAKLKKK